MLTISYRVFKNRSLYISVASLVVLMMFTLHRWEHSQEDEENAEIILETEVTSL